MFETYLEPNEHLLWAGGSGDPAKQNQESMKKDSTPGLVFVILGFILIFSCIGTVIGVVMFIIGIVLMAKKFDTGLYAVTDRRIMLYSYGQFKHIGLQQVISTRASVSSNNMGKVTVSLNGIVEFANRSSDNYINGEQRSAVVMSNIQDPVRVKQIIDDACAGVRYINYQNQGKGY